MVLADFSLANRVIVVTGGARGLGFTQTTALIESGATVYALDILPSPVSEFATLSERHPQRLHYRHLDVRDATAVRATIHDIADDEGRLDGLLAAAGILEEMPALSYTPEAFTKTLDINVTGVFLCAQACAAEMLRLRTNGASLVFVSSMSGTIANRDVEMAAYNTSKAAVVQMARNLAAEWGPYGIRVNTLSPGYVETVMVERLLQKFPERKGMWEGGNMLGRLSQPEEYRGAAVFLLSPASSYMTGSDLIIDGGHHAW